MRYFEDLTKTGIDRLPQRSFYIPEGEAVYTLLNGTWKFFYERNGDTVDPLADIRKWHRVEVPSTWQNTGYENPNYTNVNYPFPVDAPFVPMINPVGIYEREFTVTKEGFCTYLVLEGVGSCASVYVNGVFAGYTQGNHLQAEFDLTGKVHTGENTLRIVVRKWCSTSYLEDQDFFRCNGLFRDVYVLERPVGHIEDLHLVTRDNRLVEITTAPDTAVTLFDRGTVIAEGTTDRQGRLTLLVDDPVLWNAEHPYLYEAEFRKAGEVIYQSVGFRTVSVNKDRAILINGTPVKFKGVNHHDSSPTAGWVMTDAEIIKDLQRMKELNINTIRTSHYPPSPRFLDYCDKMGFYVVLETDIETHGYVTRNGGGPGWYDIDDPVWPCNQPMYKDEFVSRMERAYNRDKNHPSIFMWSVGNESGHGPNHVAMVEYLRRVDDQRLIHAEDASRKLDAALSHEKEYTDALILAKAKNEGVKTAEQSFAKWQKRVENALTDQNRIDVYSAMYPSVATLENRMADPRYEKPFFICEYAHAMGNSPGDVWQYVESMYRHEQYTGGCIWEWVDHTVLVDGVAKYGGDFAGEEVYDGNFCCDGLVFYDRSFKPASLEVKAAYAPFRVAYENGTVTLENRFDFTDLADCRVSYVAMVDGTVLEQGTVSLACPPRQRVRFDLKKSFPASCRYGCFVNVTVCDKAGHEYGTLQQAVDCPIDPVKTPGKPLALHEDALYVTAQGENFTYRFAKQTATLQSMVIDGKEWLASPVELSAMRAPIDNEGGMKKRWLGDAYGGEHIHLQKTHVYETAVSGNTVTFTASLAGVSRLPYFRYTLCVTVLDNGTMRFVLDGEVRNSCIWLARLGFVFPLKKKNCAFEYFGAGPVDNYCDSNHYATVDWYKSTARDEYVNYIMPQEYGNHTAVRELTVENRLCFASDRPFEAAVTQYSALQLTNALHTDELGAPKASYVRIDYKDSGIGSASCGPMLEEPYRVSEKKIRFSFVLTL